MSNTMTIAIDPGMSGGIAFFMPNGVIRAHAFKDEAGAVELLREAYLLGYEGFAFPAQAVLERVHAMPKQGVSSSFKFGANYGFWRGAVQAMRIPLVEVTPQAWQRGLLVSAKVQGPDRKRALVQLAKERFPAMKVTAATADALLMGQWAVGRI